MTKHRVVQFKAPTICRPVSLKGGFLSKARAFDDASVKTVDGKILVKLSTTDEGLCLAAANQSSGVNPFKHCRFWCMIRDAIDQHVTQATLIVPPAHPDIQHR